MDDLKIDNRLNGLPQDAKWLNGQGAGCWFHIIPISNSKNIFQIKRFDELKNEEFDLEFCMTKGSLNLNEPFQFGYPSHAKKCTILQGGRQLNLTRTSS